LDSRCGDPGFRWIAKMQGPVQQTLFFPAYHGLNITLFAVFKEASPLILVQPVWLNFQAQPERNPARIAFNAGL
tara:strand:- start:749 stop:970 length:222 start_codon:yes stop_codon:yes gene_type:complete